jgi:hypothetical protein
MHDSNTRRPRRIGTKVSSTFQHTIALVIWQLTTNKFSQAPLIFHLQESIFESYFINVFEASILAFFPLTRKIVYIFKQHGANHTLSVISLKISSVALRLWGSTMFYYFSKTRTYSFIKYNKTNCKGKFF